VRGARIVLFGTLFLAGASRVPSWLAVRSVSWVGVPVALSGRSRLVIERSACGLHCMEGVFRRFGRRKVGDGLPALRL